MEAKKFKNFTNFDFTWKYDGIPYTFKAGQETYLEDFKAEHFTKHLVNEALNRAGKPMNAPERTEMEAACSPSDEVVTPLEALNLNIEGDKKKGKVKKEEEFEDLKAPKKTK